MKRTKLYIACCLLLLVGVLPSCKTKQITPKTSESGVVDFTVAQVVQQQPQFTYLNISKMEVNSNYGGQQLSFRATVKAITDSLLVFSVQPLFGVEMFRLEFKPNSFRIIDKWNRKYSDNIYDVLRYTLGVDINFNVIQALFFNQLFIVNGKVTPNQFVVETFPEEPVRLIHLGAGVIHRFELLDSQMFISKTELIAEKGRLTCLYANRRLKNGVRFPLLLDMSMQLGTKKADLACQINQLEFNKPFEYTTVNVERYEQVVFSKIIP
ncbi:MAG TPA: DUF4292 domain-containing protein [Paludibacteraceae bacterium]|jgi:hypothetical protein|nr:DUF4292 domain-containing protein [Paludibacteraceae bacterium]HQB68653.1 DUF4292 domain-containing protein [Paludibacteraceae bacterium]HRS67513.1 DUF4292 domain-containing protein [Paludibacteraceae bacterium]